MKVTIYNRFISGFTEYLAVSINFLNILLAIIEIMEA